MVFIFPPRSLPSQDHLLLGSFGDSLGTEKSLPLLWDTYTGMRSRQLYGSLRLHISHELNNQTYSLTGLHFLLGYQIHSTEAMETKKMKIETLQQMAATL